MSFKERLQNLSKDLGETKLLIVSKNRSLEEIKSYYDLGQRDFGENKVQELSDKAQALKATCPQIRWHMIGHLQTNKINNLLKIPHLKVIHSVDNQELLDKLIKNEDKLNHPVEIFLQVNTSHESEKSGFETYTDLTMAVESLKVSQKLKLTGLMTMGAIRTDNFEAEALRCFQELNVEKNKLEAEFNLKLKTSMGMSKDYKIAVLEKSSWVRLGTMMFEG